MGQVLLEVAVLGPRDVSGAVEGGADRLLLSTPDGLSPEPSVVSAVCRESAAEVHVVLRLNNTWSTTGGEMTRLVGLAEDYLGSGAAGISFGFLDADLEVDADTCGYLSAQLPHVPWTFGRAIDDTLDLRRSWRRLAGLPGLVGVRAAGSPRGLAAGYDELLALASSDPVVARTLVAGGGLVAEQVPWFVRAGVRQLHLDLQARPGGSAKAYVDAGHVRSWRLLLDHAVERNARSAG
ncbi:copper homeostasis protein CutC [Nocardioides sp. MAH-18]|uniref:Copper homeostasis protein cutC homolog n=1 Tax=Nocardioides agri TaxID=2682843 RepID=A0A6L6XQK8_9ACTN|nr:MULTISPECIES: copper homeostasis protein CutC [unclassified Nocardioides]MBA2954397.1 copper homeostasis protein CutC [Nocardioides sp. CGMCC 1.13656]MVQ49258.1 copper homeostasis protein CutC [Nocardioides sp. MAH-18]